MAHKPDAVRIRDGPTARPLSHVWSKLNAKPPKEATAMRMVRCVRTVEHYGVSMQIGTNLVQTYYSPRQKGGTLHRA